MRKIVRSFILELRRRHVFRVATIYAAFLFAVIAFAADIEEAFDLESWVARTMIVLALLGLPVALVFAWVFELTPHGVIREKYRHLFSDEPDIPPKPKSELASIAVLPFQSSAESNDTLLATAIPLELNNTLCRVQRLRIVSPQSSLALSREGKDLKSIAADLDVDYAISGVVSQIGDRFRVIAELYDANRDSLLWNERFELEAEHAFEAERKIAEAATMAFGGERLRLEVEQASLGATTNQAAWELVQNARAYLLSYTRDSVDAAVSLLRQAVEKDENYAVGHAQLALATAEKTINAIGDDPEGDLAEALAAIEKAESLAPNDSVVLRSAGVVHAYIGDNAESIRLLKRATALAPYDLGAWGYFGWPLNATGIQEHRNELLEILDRLLAQGAQHPGRPYWLFHKSVALSIERKLEQALDCIKPALDEQPRFAIGWMHTANLHALMGNAGAAEESVQKSLAINQAFTPAYYLRLIDRLTDDAAVARQRTKGLSEAGFAEVSIN